MSGLWDNIKDKAKQVGTAAGIASRKAQLKAEILLIDRDVNSRMQSFGVQLYDYVSPLTENASFYAADDRLTRTVRPPLLAAQREIAALENKRGKIKQRINQADADRAATFARKATNWQEKIKNAGKSTFMAGGEAKLKTELALNDVEIKHHKQTFGVTLYPVFEELEDNEGWVPNNREIRSIYDNCRKGIEEVKNKKLDKLMEIKELDGGGTHNEAETLASNNNGFVPPSPSEQKTQFQDTPQSNALASANSAISPPGLYGQPQPFTAQPTPPPQQQQQQQVPDPYAADPFASIATRQSGTEDSFVNPHSDPFSSDIPQMQSSQPQALGMFSYPQQQQQYPSDPFQDNKTKQQQQDLLF